MRGKINLEGVEFHAFHGLYPEEQKNGNRFLVDLTLEITFQEKALQDDPTGILDYSKVLLIVQDEMKKPKYLLEAVASCILERLKKNFPEIEKIQIRISKLQPPLQATLRAVSIELVWPNT